MNESSLELKVCSATFCMNSYVVPLFVSHIECVLWYNDSLFIYKEILCHYLEPKYSDALSPNFLA